MNRKRLQRLIAAKDRLRSVQQASLVRAAQATAEAEGRVDHSRQVYATAAEAMGNVGSRSAGDLQLDGLLMERTRRIIARQNEQVGTYRQAEEVERESLLMAKREVQVLEVLRERAAEADRLRERRLEQTAMDEIASRVARRGKR